METSRAGGQESRRRAGGLGVSLALLAISGAGCGRVVVADGIPDPDTVPQWSAATSTLLVTRGSAWRYLDDGSNQATAWRETGFDDGAWKMGAAQLGYGDGDEKTVVGYGGDANAKYITTYFRHSFTVTHPDLYGELTLELLRDDGAVAYLNGVEIYRTNMPSGALDYRTLAADNSPDENKYFPVTFKASPALIRQGTNVLAVEVHQYSQWSSDAGFDASLSGVPVTTPTPPPPPPPAAGNQVASWMANYGFWSADAIAVARQHQLVVLHPHRQETSRALIAQLQQGVDAGTTSDDVKVICYVSIGEDLRAGGLTDAQLAQDPRFRGDGTGPRVDPRGPNADGKALSGIDPRGAPSNGGAGYASYYLDDDTAQLPGHRGRHARPQRQLRRAVRQRRRSQLVPGRRRHDPRRGRRRRRAARAADHQLRPRPRLRRRLPGHARHRGAQRLHELREHQPEQVRVDGARLLRLRAPGPRGVPGQGDCPEPRPVLPGPAPPALPVHHAGRRSTSCSTRATASTRAARTSGIPTSTRTTASTSRPSCWPRRGAPTASRSSRSATPKARPRRCRRPR